MALIDEIRTIVAAIPAELSESKGVFSFSWVVAERKMLFCRQKLVYSGRFRIDEARKEFTFSEMLNETGFGLGGGPDSGMSPGRGFKKSVCRTGFGPRQETIEERSTFLRQKYSYTFDFSHIRERIKTAAAAAGYQFSYRLIL
ncbi:MAG: hypothetical protein C4531_13925 [Desulfurivibrio sp.]|nr:MAG: hypothetical protein C4531_13925 [Desulfurivibrio sp.]